MIIGSAASRMRCCLDYGGVDMVMNNQLGIGPEFDIMNQLRRDGWQLYDMAEFQPNIGPVTEWCRNTLGPMMVSYDYDQHCNWHGALVEMPGSQQGTAYHKCIFAFKNTADYTMLKLKWSK